MNDACAPRCPPEAPQAGTCEEKLRKALNVYDQLMSGAAQVISFKDDNGIEVTYRQKSIPHLLDYITRLNASCPCLEAAEVLGLADRQVFRPVYGRSRFRTPHGRC